MKVGILFDLDGTLLDSLEDLKDSVNYALGQHGCPARTLEEVRRFVGTGVVRLIQQALPGKADDPDYQEVLTTYRAHYAKNSHNKTRPYAGVLEALEQLGQKYPMAVVSNKPDTAVKPLCRLYFGDIYALGEDPAIPRKPAPDMLFKAMADIGVETCVYVGDSEVDVATARNAGVPCLSVLWGFRGRQELEAAGGLHFCDDTAVLAEALEKMIDNMK